jgi:hypothetical protein
VKPAPWTTQSGAPSADEASVRDAGYGASAPPWPRGDGRAGGAERADVEGGLPAEEKEARPTEALLLRPLLQKRADSDPAHIELVRLSTAALISRFAITTSKSPGSTKTDSVC